MKNIIKFLDKYGIYIIIFVCLSLGLISLIFKNATLDDDLYLWETSMMAEALHRGEWIGDYAVGTHGFLFKLPVAIVFLLTGPSLAIATVWNVILACLSLFLFYKLLKSIFLKSIVIPFLGTLLLFTNFQFILNLPTYMREFPVFLSVILFLYLVVKKKSYWLIGLSLALIFDAKEYVLFMIIPGYLIYILISNWKGFNFKTVWEYIKPYTQILLPTLVFIALMITTSIIPVNMYALSVIPGVTKGGIEYNIKHFDSDNATTNRIEDSAPTIQNIFEKENEGIVRKILNTVTNYVGKILYPRTFSFLSVAKIVFFPSLLTSLLLFKKAIKKKDSVFIFFSLIFWSFISIFILRASFDRYLFPILPIVTFFFIVFIKDVVKERKTFIMIVIVSSLFAIAGLFFEVDYIGIKIGLNILFILMYVLYFLFQNRFKYLYIYLISTVSAITFCVVSFFFYANGQLHQYLLWGNDYEVKKIVSLFDNNQRIMANDVGWDILVKVYRQDNAYNPQWKLELEDRVPRKKNLKMFEKMTSFNIFGKTMEDSKKEAMDYNIEKVVLAVSTIPNQPFKYQEKLEGYKSADWLTLSEVVKLKNKEVYIFDVNR